MENEYLASLFSLRDKTVVITGGTGGIGSAIVEAVLQAGVSSIASLELPGDSLSSALREKVSKLGGKIVSFECDMRNPKSLRSGFQAIEDAGLTPDILLNCAGVMRRNPCEAATDEELDLLVDVNIKAFYISMQEFGRRLLSQGKQGKIVNIASVTSYQAGFNTSVYSSTKGAVLQMTKAFSNEWSGRGIQVNCIAPGFIQTSMTAAYRDDQKMTDYLMARVPMGRWGQPQDLIAAVLFLISPGNTFTSGACLIVDGGFCGK